MESITWLLIIGIFLLVIGGGLMIYGIHKHEDENEKTTTHKAMLYGGIAVFVIGVILIIIYFVSKGRKAKESLTIDNKEVVQEMEMAQMNSGYNNPMNQGYNNPMNSGMNSFNNPMNQGYGNQGYGNQMNQGYYNPMTPVYQGYGNSQDMSSMYPGQGYGGFNQFSV